MSLGITFLLGVGGGYLLWGRGPEAGATGTQPSGLVRQQVNPAGGYELPVQYGDIGVRLRDAGAIDYDRLVQHYEQLETPLTETEQAVLNDGSDAPIVINRQNAHFLLNFFWALGLTNRNPVLTEGAMTQYGADQRSSSRSEPRASSSVARPPSSTRTP
jgi:hypothetical protein